MMALFIISMVICFFVPLAVVVASTWYAEIEEGWDE